MAEQFRLQQEFTSPYKATRIYVKGGTAFFGIRTPLEVQEDGDEEEWTVKFGEEGCLDFIAGKTLQDRALWRVIADFNKINDVAAEIVPGLVLKIPKLEHVNAALLAAGQRVRSVET